MTKDELLNYLKSAINLETDVATQEGIINNYNEVYLSKKPQLVLQNAPTKPDYPVVTTYKGDWSKNSEDSPTYALVISIFFFIGAVPALIFFPVAGVILAIIGICLALPFINKKRKVNENNNIRLSAYQDQMEKYNKQCEEVNNYNLNAKKLYDERLASWNESGKENDAILQEPLNKTKELLGQLYKKDFIYPKYQSLPALTSIYEYLLTGRCEELAGAHGAYNLYEDEVRKDTVISQLNIVIDNLGQIKQNQYMLYQQATLIRNKTTAIKQELQQIKGYTINLTELTALNTYYSALTARNTDISATFALLNG